MATELDLRPISHLTADAIGAPGKRVFYLQVQQTTRTTTLILEKFQLQSLSISVEQFLAEIQNRFPTLAEAASTYVEENMHIHPPVDPLFRVGELALGYEAENDLIILVAKELLPEPEDDPAGQISPPEEPAVVRIWCTRSQIRALAHWGLEVVSRGRPLCPQCGAPIDPEEGHFCPKKNGHRG